MGENPRQPFPGEEPNLLLSADFNEEDDWEATDDVKGGTLDAKLVHDARQRELQYLRERQVYVYASTKEAIQRCGRRPLRLKWIDTDKGGAGQPNVRSRLVCTEIRRQGMDAIFAPTPPLDAMRAVIAHAAERVDAHGVPLTLQLIDISRAHFYATSVREVYVQLPAVDPQHGKPDICGLLRRTMYRTLDAAEQWAAHYTRVLQNAGFP